MQNLFCPLECHGQTIPMLCAVSPARLRAPAAPLCNVAAPKGLFLLEKLLLCQTWGQARPQAVPEVLQG